MGQSLNVQQLIIVVYQINLKSPERGKGEQMRKQVYVPIELIDIIEKLRKEEDRGIGSMISVLLKEALKARGKL